MQLTLKCNLYVFCCLELFPNLKTQLLEYEFKIKKTKTQIIFAAIKTFVSFQTDWCPCGAAIEKAAGWMHAIRAGTCSYLEKQSLGHPVSRGTLDISFWVHFNFVLSSFQNETKHAFKVNLEFLIQLSLRFDFSLISVWFQFDFSLISAWFQFDFSLISV